jgi:hypothetical protein
VILTVDGEHLHVDAPAGALMPELRQALADHKAELLALLTPLASAPVKSDKPVTAAGICPNVSEIGGVPDELAAWAAGEFGAVAETVLYDPGRLPPDLAEQVAALHARLDDLEERARRGQELTAAEPDPRRRERYEARLAEIGQAIFEAYEELGRWPVAWEFPG